jgi:drug/metabolite transporter (DMT)-like permease
MSHFVLVVYRQAVATVVLAPFAFFLERNVRPKLTFYIFCQIFVLGLLGPVIDQNFSYLGLKLTSPTYATALSNILPCMTFVIALLFRMERVDIKKLRSGAKLVGTIVCVGGAMLMTLYKGPIVRMLWSPHHQSPKDNQTSTPAARNKDWIVGSVLMLAATLAWSILFILQAAVLKKYSAQLSLATLICLLGTLQATVLSLALVRDPSKWALGWDINLLSAVYSGVVASAVAYYVQGLCMRVKGPVFATAFSPLMMIIVAVMGSVILSEHIYLGSVLGGVMIAIGLYAVLWGKLKDSKISTDKNCSEALPNSEEILPKNENKADDIEAASNQPLNNGLEPQL